MEQLTGLPVAIEAALADQWGLVTTGMEALFEGCWRVDTSELPVVVRWDRTGTTVVRAAWVGELTAYVARRFPLAPPPVPAVDGALAVEVPGGVLTVVAHLPGAGLDPGDPLQAEASASALATVHRLLLDWPGPPPPAAAGHEIERAWLVDTLGDLAGFEDPILDRWLRTWLAGPATSEIRGLVTGDWSPPNLGLVDGAVVLLDWRATHEGLLAIELAQAAWDHAGPDPEAIRTFVAAYGGAGGTVPDGGMAVVVLLVRAWLRFAAGWLVDDGASDALTEVARLRDGFDALR